MLESDEAILLLVSDLLDDCIQVVYALEKQNDPFCWFDLMSKTGTVAVQDEAFNHVLISHSPLKKISEDSWVEISPALIVPDDRFHLFWPARIISDCGGPLQLIKYLGDSKERWINLLDYFIKPAGWVKNNSDNCKMRPPEDFDIDIESNQAFVNKFFDCPESVTSIGTSDLKIDCLRHLDFFVPGKSLELQDISKPLSTSFVTIIDCFNGRLRLRPIGVNCENHDHWLWYQSELLHPIGWTSACGRQRQNCKINREYWPTNNADLQESFFGNVMKNSVNFFAFKHSAVIKSHDFVIGQKLEVVDPTTRCHIRPASIVEILNEFWFVIELLVHKDVSGPRINCHCLSPYILPVGWARQRNLKLTVPQGWLEETFDWSVYLREQGCRSAHCGIEIEYPDDDLFYKYQRLEVVHPRMPNLLCPGTVTHIEYPLIWVHLDNTVMLYNIIYDLRTFEYFPVGWAATSGHLIAQLNELPVVDMKDYESDNLYSSSTELNFAVRENNREKQQHFMPKFYLPTVAAWCPVIYINSPRCYCGPWLCHSRLCLMPKSLGPGPLSLVLTKLMCFLLGASFRPREFQTEIAESQPDINHLRSSVSLKVRIRGRRLEGNADICVTTAQLPAWLQSLCAQIECCPRLFSLQPPAMSAKGHYIKCLLHCKTQAKLRGLYDLPIDIYRTSKKSKAATVGGRKANRNDDDDLPAVTYQRRPSIMLPLVSQRSPIQTRGAKLPEFDFGKKRKRVKEDGTAVNEELPRSKQSKVVPNDVLQQQLDEQQTSTVNDFEIPPITSNPLDWSTDQLAEYLAGTEVSHLIPLLKKQEIDGQAFLLLDLETVTKNLQINLGPALKLCCVALKLKEFLLKDDDDDDVDDAALPSLIRYTEIKHFEPSCLTNGI